MISMAEAGWIHQTNFPTFPGIELDYLPSFFAMNLAM